MLGFPQASGSSPIRNSIVRRSLLITGFVVVGHGFYYLLVLSANRILPPGGFGRFYAAWAVLNVLYAPASIFTMLLTSALSDAFRAGGIGAIPATLGRTARRLGPFVVAIVIVLEILLYIGGKIVRVDSFGLVILLPITAASFLTIETVRSAFAAMLQTTWFGASWLFWCLAQCVFGAAALLVLQAPWAAFFGMIIANLLVFATLAVAIRRRCRVPATPPPTVPDVVFASLRSVVPFCTALVGFVLFNNADVLVAYLFMDPAQLGAYAAAALLPKAIVTVTQPVVQMILPVLSTIQSESGGSRRALLKALAVTFALGAAGAAVLWSASDLVCGGRYGIASCRPAPMIMLATAAIFFAVMRLTIVAELGAARYLVAHLPLMVLVGFVVLELLIRSSGTELARNYTFAALASLGLMASVGLGQRLAERSAAPNARSRPYGSDATPTVLPPRS